MSLTETTLSQEVLLEGIVFRVDRHDVRLGDGSESKRDIVRHAGGVGVLARTPDQRFLMVRQYRKAVECEVLEIVAGMREPNEEPKRTAVRELEEETGYKVTSIRPLGQSYASPGYTDEVVHLFFAETEADPGNNRLDVDERLVVESYSLAEMNAMMQDNIIKDSKTLAAWFFAGAKECL
jgi:ADP-ribose pyrophosphatase